MSLVTHFHLERPEISSVSSSGLNLGTIVGMPVVVMGFLFQRELQSIYCSIVLYCAYIHQPDMHTVRQCRSQGGGVRGSAAP